MRTPTKSTRRVVSIPKSYVKMAAFALEYIANRVHDRAHARAEFMKSSIEGDDPEFVVEIFDIAHALDAIEMIRRDEDACRAWGGGESLNDFFSDAVDALQEVMNEAEDLVNLDTDVVN